MVAKCCACKFIGDIGGGVYVCVGHSSRSGNTNTPYDDGDDNDDDNAHDNAHQFVVRASRAVYDHN